MASQTWDGAKDTYHSAAAAVDQSRRDPWIAGAAGIIAGAATFIGCEALTLGIGSIGCLAAAGAAGGALSAAMLCPEGQSTWTCAGAGALAGAVGGATFGLAAGAGTIAAGAAAGATTDITTQLLNTDAPTICI